MSSCSIKNETFFSNPSSPGINDHCPDFNAFNTAILKHTLVGVTLLLGNFLTGQFFPILFHTPLGGREAFQGTAGKNALWRNFE